MASETTPLVETVVVVQQRPRYPHTIIRRLVSTLLLLGLITAIVLFLIPSKVFQGGHRHGDIDDPWLNARRPKAVERHLTNNNHKKLKDILLDSPSADKLAQWSRYYTAGPHLAGKNLSQAEWTRDLWRSFGIEATIVSYDVYINYPVSSRLALLRQQNSKPTTVMYECSLEEDILESDPVTALPDRVPTFHGYSAPGNITAQYVYVNFGTVDDFKDLVAAEVDLEGKIALVKYGRNFRGIKVQLAQAHGMVGVVIYDDPGEDGDITEVNGYKPYPQGPARNPSAVQRGSVQFLSTGPGDPTTIGYPSKPGVPRMSPNGTTPQIPSLPISYRDALPLLLALNGHGRDSKELGKWWQGGGLAHLGVEYSIGPSPTDLALNLVNAVNYTITPLWNVIGIINGTQYADQSVIVGNHRDAWIAGGAGDPNSGSAALDEVVRSYGKALDSGWKPQRTMVFASWDGEEYGLLGSTEWVEEFLPWIQAEAMAYVNVDVATSGPNFAASASPLLNDALRNAAVSVMSPNQTIPGQTIYDVWRTSTNARISTLGSGSDYTAFQDFAGASSVNVGFQGGKGHAVYHYHSNYDNFQWMAKYGDPGFMYHLACTRILSVLVADLVETPVVPFLAREYANALVGYIQSAKDRLKQNGQFTHADHDRLDKLDPIVQKVLHAATDLDQMAGSLMREIESAPVWWRWLRGRVLRRRTNAINRALKLFERSLLFEGGLDGRSWFKHLVFAPGRWTGYAGETLPGLIESIEDGDLVGLERWVNIIASALMRCEKVLHEAL